MSAECKLVRWLDDVEEVERPMLLAELLEVDDWVRPALFAVVPEKVLGLSRPPEAEEPLAEREPARAAPALAGLCFGFMPAASPADNGGGRPLPSSAEVDAADPGRTRSASLLLSLTLRAPTDVFAVSVTGAGSVSVLEDGLTVATEVALMGRLSTADLESGPPAKSACIACSADD